MPFAIHMDLNHLVCDLNLLKKQAELLGPKIVKYVSFAITKMNSKNFCVKKMLWYFVIMFAVL